MIHARPNRLVIDGHRLGADRTGVGRCLEGLIADWSTSGWPLDETLIVLRDPSGLERVADRKCLKTSVIGTTLPGLVWETTALRSKLRRDDVLLAPANLVPPNWRGRTVLLLYDTLLWSDPTGFPLGVRLRFAWRYRLAARRATHVVVPSEATARDAARIHGLTADRMTVAYPGPDPRFRPLNADDPLVQSARMVVGDAPFFLFVGKRSRRRNVPATLAAFAAHRRVHPDHRLAFVGPAAEALTADGVIDAGHVDEPTLHGLLASAVAVLYPSNYEGFGLPVVEAMACGGPVVTLRNSALVESGGDAACYLDEPSPEALAAAMARLATDPAFRQSFVDRGLDNVKRFPRARFADAVSSAIRRVAT